MPYTTNNPPNKIKNMPKGAQKIWIATFNANIDKGEEAANKIAYAAIKNKYYQDKDGNWKEKMEILEKIYVETYRNCISANFEPEITKLVAKYAVLNYMKNGQAIDILDLFITKASFVDDKMTIAFTASDTESDTFSERMSLQLFKSFVEEFTRGHGVYISLAHYPDFEDKSGDLGKVTLLYIDGNKLKGKAEFYDKPISVSAFNSIRKDRRDNVDPNKRIRISIGFYDKMHKHGDYTWKYAGYGSQCLRCSMGDRDNKIYLSGSLSHCALTRVPANKRAEIDWSS